MPLPAPIARGRLIVLQDLFESALYKDCAGHPDPSAPAAQLTWLRTQLDHARAAHEQVWFMAHIPPGVNVYTTFSQKHDVCAGQPPITFLGGDGLTQTLTAYPDIVRLALFAHTHNDEMHLLRPDPTVAGEKPGPTPTPNSGAPHLDSEMGASTSSPGPVAPGSVATKLNPSISPINGNQPAFTIAQVDRRTALLADFRVLMASNQTGIATRWTEEYQFTRLYHLPTDQPAYTTANLSRLLDGFIADTSAAAQTSNDYAQMFYPGGGKGTFGLHLLWHQYTCGFENHTAATYRACLCPAK